MLPSLRKNIPRNVTQRVIYILQSPTWNRTINSILAFSFTAITHGTEERALFITRHSPTPDVWK